MSTDAKVWSEDGIDKVSQFSIKSITLEFEEKVFLQKVYAILKLLYIDKFELL